LQTFGTTGSASLATAISGITLASNADYSSNTQSFSSGALDGAAVSLTVTATDDRLVEGPENGLSASLVNTTSNASVTETGTGTVNVTDNDSATVTLSPTIALYSFETGPNGAAIASAVDSSGNGLNGSVLSGTPRYSSNVPVGGGNFSLQLG